MEWEAFPGKEEMKGKEKKCKGHYGKVARWIMEETGRKKKVWGVELICMLGIAYIMRCLYLCVLATT